MKISELKKAERMLHDGKYSNAIKHMLDFIIELNNEGLLKKPHEKLSLYEISLITRSASAITMLVANERFILSEKEYKHLCYKQEEIETLFSISGFQDSSFMPTLIGSEGEDGELNFSGIEPVKKYFAITPPNRLNEAFIDIIQSLPINVLSPYLLGSTANINKLDAHGKKIRSKLIALGEKLSTVELKNEDMDIIYRAWVHCHDHEIKESLHFRFFVNHAIRKWIKSNLKPSNISKPQEKINVVIFAMSDNEFNEIGKFIPFIKSLHDEPLNIILFKKNKLPSPFKADRCIDIDDSIENLSKIVEQVASISPGVIFYPNIDKRLLMILMANMRLAEMQVIGEHQSSSMSDNIDYIMTSQNNICHDDYLEQIVKYC